MKQKVKDIVTKGKTWLKNHKKGVIITLGSIAAGLTGIAIAKKVKNNNECDCEDYDFDPGRDCIMKFVVDDDSNEVLGEVPCTESYAKDMIDIYSNEVSDDKEA